MCSLTPGSQKSATFPPYIVVGRKLGTFGFSYIVLKIGLAKLFILTLWVYSSKGQNGILGRIVSASGWNISAWNGISSFRWIDPVSCTMLTVFWTATWNEQLKSQNRYHSIHDTLPQFILQVNEEEKGGRVSPLAWYQPVLTLGLSLDVLGQG